MVGRGDDFGGRLPASFSDRRAGHRVWDRSAHYSDARESRGRRALALSGKATDLEKMYIAAIAARRLPSSDRRE